MCLLVGALRRGMAEFNAEGTATAFATVLTLCVLTLVLPSFTTSAPGGEFTGSQLAFAAVASLALYGLFVFIQAFRHRDYFLPEGTDEEHAEPPSDREAIDERRAAGARPRGGRRARQGGVAGHRGRWCPRSARRSRRSAS